VSRLLSGAFGDEGGITMALEDEFHQEMLALYRETGRAIGYWSNYYLRGVRNKGGLAYAKHLLAPGRKIDSGLQRLMDAGRADLSVEARVLKPRYTPLFTPAEIAEAGRRLQGAAAAPTHWLLLCRWRGGPCRARGSIPVARLRSCGA
jgi:hypothetical protein